MNVSDAIRGIVGDAERQVIVGTVTKVDGKMCDIEPVNGDAELFDVRLLADNNYGFWIEPEVNSKVVVLMIEGAGALVVMADKPTKIWLSTSSGDLGGMVKVGNLLNRLNALEVAMNTHVHTSTPPGQPTSPNISPIRQTTRNELENPNVRHA